MSFDEPGRPLDASLFTKASTARIYNYLLGGKDNYLVDRIAAAKIIDAAPSAPALARENFRFAGRATSWAVGEVEAGLVLDIGMGLIDHLPKDLRSIDQVVHDRYPDVEVVGVDPDPIVLSHFRALFRTRREAAACGYAAVASGDVRDLDTIFANPGLLARGVDLEQRAVVVLAAVLHFIGPDEGPSGPLGILTQLHERMAPGSALVISHACSSSVDQAAVADIERGYDGASSDIHFRTEQQIAELIKEAGWFAQVPPYDVQKWAPLGSTYRQVERRQIKGVRVVGTVAFSSKGRP
ncbi:SAM-dependent methyltransferase [Spirillospora sp. NPDC047279]|uniref:SAM-dependent methyltransferase n=1 Tax=Spirillospora sp. NPDC047279 TaxID=3155478 RepID=UPI0033D1E89A